MPTDDAAADSAFEAFLAAVWADVDADAVMPLLHYVERFPDCAERIGAEYRRILKQGTDETRVLDAAARSTSDTSSTGGASKISIVDKFRIQRVLGSGGQGTVYLATDTALRRSVALKVLNPDFELSDDAHDNLRREARVLGELDDPGICTVFETGVSPHGPFIAMQYIEGMTLQRKLAAPAPDGSFVLFDSNTDTEREPTVETDADASSTTSASTDVEGLMQFVRFIEQAARSLHVAHEKRVVHRDIKPGNLMVRPDGRPVVLDFGLAVDRADVGSDGSSTLEGTYPYMSPEQIARLPLDGRTDVWSLAVTLYECVTGQRPFRADSVNRLKHAIATEPAEDPRRLNRLIPRDLAVVLEMAMEKSVDRRYATAEAFADDLRRVRRREPVHARPIGPIERGWRWAQRNALIASFAALAFVSLAVGLVVSLRFGSETRDALHREQIALQGERTARERAQAEEAKARKAESDAREAERRARVLAARRRLDVLTRAASELWPVTQPTVVAQLKRWRSSFEALETEVERVTAGDESSDAIELRQHLERAKRTTRGVPPLHTVRMWFEIEPEKPESRTERDARPALRQVAVRLTDDQEPLEIDAVEWSVKVRLDMAAYLQDRLKADAGDWNTCIRYIKSDKSPYQLKTFAPIPGLRPVGRTPNGFCIFDHLLSRLVLDEKDELALSVDSDRGIRLILLPGGLFKGGNDRLTGAELEHARRAGTLLDDVGTFEVRLRPFLIAEHELTQESFIHATRGYNPSHFGRDQFEAGEAWRRHPVERIDYHEAVAVLRVLGLQPPTEAQWEYAARGGTATPWWTGVDAHSVVADGGGNVFDRTAMDSDLPVYDRAPDLSLNDGRAFHGPVDAFRPNPFGLRGVHGNVWEWTTSSYVDYSRQPPLAGIGETPADKGRVIRGGSFLHPALSSRSGVRFERRVNHSASDIGVRPVLNLPR